MASGPADLFARIDNAGFEESLPSEGILTTTLGAVTSSAATADTVSAPASAKGVGESELVGDQRIVLGFASREKIRHHGPPAPHG